MRIVILSPHRDDAAFSCGLTMQALLQAGATVTVLNIFTRSDYAIDLRTIRPDLSLADAVSQARRQEDEQFVADAALAAGRAPKAVPLVDMHRLDAPLRLAVVTEQVLTSPLTDAEVQQEASSLAAELASIGAFDLYFAPLALGDHIDHRIVREAAKRFVAPDELCFYEDLPYAARISPAERKTGAQRATAWKPGAEFSQYALHFGNGPHLKHRFAMHYPSQIAPAVATEMADYAAQWGSDGSGVERWWATRAGASVALGLLQRAPVPRTLLREQQ